MDTKQPEAIRTAEWLEGIRGNTWPSYTPQEAAAELRRQHAEIETLRAGYSAARLEIESLQERVQQLGQLARDVNSRRVVELEAQLAAVGAGGVEPLRKRECLHQISEPAREPLTEVKMHKDLAALCKRIFNARIGKACSNCDGGTYQSDNNGYGQFHRCSKCCYVPMWGEDGRELGAPIAAAKKGGQHGAE